MIKGLKNIIIVVIAILNIIAIMAMVGVAYSPWVDPIKHPVVSSSGVAFPITLVANVAFLAAWIFIKRRMILIPIVGFIAVAGQIRTYIPLNIPKAPPEGCIKLMSYNIKSYWGKDGKEESSAALLEYLKQEQPDILCIQEDTEHGRSKLKKETELFPYNQSAKAGNGVKRKGINIYSKFPILRCEQIEYESEGNNSMAFFLKINADTVIVINNHLESTHLSPDQRKEYKDLLLGNIEDEAAETATRGIVHQLAAATALRAPQADAVAQYIKKHTDYPIIVCGDFNDNPISYTHRTISKELTDCFVATANGVGISYNQGGFWVRIDNILCSRHFTPYNCYVDNNVELSDHYPIICSLKRTYN